MPRTAGKREKSAHGGATADLEKESGHQGRWDRRIPHLQARVLTTEGGNGPSRQQVKIGVRAEISGQEKEVHPGGIPIKTQGPPGAAKSGLRQAAPEKHIQVREGSKRGRL